MVEHWHQPVAAPAPRDALGRPFFVVEVINTGERLELRPNHADGGFSSIDIDRLAHALRDTRRGYEHPIDSGLVDLVYKTQLHFKAEAIRVISGYRMPRAGSASNHGRGRAIDIIVPAVDDERVAAFLRSQGFTGVGLYPTSGFVHLDVRPSSYSWEDRSGPGQSRRERATRRRETAASDAEARRRGQRAPRPWSEPSNDVDAVWEGRATPSRAAPQPSGVEDDTDQDR